MCDPASLILAGTVISAGASIASGMQQQASFNAQAAATDRQAELVGLQGEFQAEQLTKKNESTLATIDASFSAEGIRPSDVVVRQSAEELELEVEALKFGTAINQSNLGTQANIQRGQGSTALFGGFAKASSTIIGSPLGKSGFKNLSPQ